MYCMVFSLAIMIVSFIVSGLIFSLLIWAASCVVGPSVFDHMDDFDMDFSIISMAPLSDECAIATIDPCLLGYMDLTDTSVHILTNTAACEDSLGETIADSQFGHLTEIVELDDQLYATLDYTTGRVLKIDWCNDLISVLGERRKLLKCLPRNVSLSDHSPLYVHAIIQYIHTSYRTFNCQSTFDKCRFLLEAEDFCGYPAAVPTITCMCSQAAACKCCCHMHFHDSVHPRNGFPSNKSHARETKASN